MNYNSLTVFMNIVFLHYSLTSAVCQQMINISSGIFQIGASDGLENERPVYLVSMQPFSLGRTEVTNAEYAAFVGITGYVTQAERAGWGWVWSGTWRPVYGANWRQPQGPTTQGPTYSITQRFNHPVVQVSWLDAQVYCQWQGLRLPTDAEWEYAARGSVNSLYPWGNVLPRDGGRQRANYGTEACCAPDTQDGHVLTAPVGSYPFGVSPSGAHDMAGNVWEWVADERSNHAGLKIVRGGGWGSDAYSLRTTYRQVSVPTASYDMVGFRCAGPLR